MDQNTATQTWSLVQFMEDGEILTIAGEITDLDQGRKILTRLNQSGPEFYGLLEN